MESTAERMPWSGRAFAWAGALLFALSLSYFLFTYALTFGEIQPGPAAAAPIVWNLGVFTVFALHHSVFARGRVRAWVSRTVPPPLERSFYVWVASLLFVAVCASWKPVAGVAWAIPQPFGWLVYGAMASGAWLSVRSAGVIDIWELAGVRPVLTPNSQQLRSVNSQHLGTPSAQQPRVPNSQHVRTANSQHPIGSRPTETVGTWEFKTRGPYGFVRHPIYLGWFLMMFGVPTMTNTRLVFALVSCTYVLIAIPIEERTLRQVSTGRYDEYMRVVRWRLMPGLY